MGSYSSSSSSSSSPGNYNNSEYGDIMKVETTGASQITAQQDKLGYAGIRASHKMAEMDEERMTVYREKILSVASLFEIDPVIIAAIISRESRAGNTLKNGWGDHGKAWGLMQVDIHPDGGGHKPKGDWDSEEHLTQATEILLKFIDKISVKFPGTREQQLKGGLAAYNKGDKKVHSYEKVDENTTGKDYSNDVVARAQWYKRRRFFNNCSS